MLSILQNSKQYYLICRPAAIAEMLTAMNVATSSSFEFDIKQDELADLRKAFEPCYELVLYYLRKVGAPAIFDAVTTRQMSGLQFKANPVARTLHVEVKVTVGLISYPYSLCLGINRHATLFTEVVEHCVGKETLDEIEYKFLKL